MKIGLDLRFLKENNLFSSFVVELITILIKSPEKNTYIIYTNSGLNIKQSKNIITKKVDIKLWSLKEQTTFYKILKKDNNNLMIFFDIHKPIMYKKDYYIFIPSLKRIYYQNFNTYFKKYKYLYFLKWSTKYAQKIICFDENTKDELSERLDIKEEKTNILTPFFTWINTLKNTIDIKTDIKVKNNIKNDFLIYPWGNWIEKNIDRLIKVFRKINEKESKIDLVILWEDIGKDINIRDLILSEKIEKNIHFIWNIKSAEKKNYYNNSIWVIFPSLYESFPFHLNEAIYFNTNIISWNLQNVKMIFWDSISYFFPISTSSMIKETTLFINKQNKPIYTKILDKINPENTVKQLIKIIN